METTKENHLLLCDRVQKITEALYRVTELFSDREPLKWQLRKDAIELFDFLLSAENKEFLNAENISNFIRKINRALQLAFSSSSAFVSSINFEVLRREYLSLNESIESRIEIEKKELLLSTRPGLVESNGHPSVDGIDSNGQPSITNGHNGQSGETKEIKKIKEIGSPIGDPISKTTESNGQPILLKERKRKILNLIKEDKWISIREISISLPELGAKSIQRDLLEMADAGILKKIGDKRWRKYSLV